ncbi:MAG: LysR family transcriptional regulator [Sporolactobacillus sp.]
MEFKQLKYFIQVAEDLNYTIASKKLYVTQPTLSWTTKKLEEELGFKLFDYDGKKLKMTVKGKRFLDMAKHLMNEYEKTMDAVHSNRSGISGTICLGLPVLFTDCFFVDPIMAFLEQYPEIKISTIHNGSLAIQKMVQSGKIDVGIISHLNPPDNLDVVELPNYSYQEVFVASAKHPFAKNKIVSFSELKHETFILLTSAFTLGELPIIQCRENGFTPNIKFRSSEWSFICDAVAHSQCVSVMPRPLVSRYFRQDGLAQLPINDDRSQIPISVITKKNEDKSIAVQKFLAFFINYCINENHCVS